MCTSHGEDLLPQGNPATSVSHPSVPIIQEWGLLVKLERGFMLRKYKNLEVKLNCRLISAIILHL